VKLPFKLPFKFGKKRDDDDDDDDDDFGDIEDFDPDDDGAGPAAGDADSGDDIDEEMLAGDGVDASPSEDDGESPDDIDEDMLAGGDADEDEEEDEEHEAEKQSASDDLDAVAAGMFGDAAMEGDEEDGASFPDLDGLDSDDVDFGDDDDDDDENGDRFAWFTGKTRLIIIASAAGVLLLSLVGGGTWWFLAEPEEDVASEDGGALVAMSLPPKSKAKSGLTPPRGRSLNTIGTADTDDKPPPDADSDEPADEDRKTESDDDAAADEDKQASGAAASPGASLNAIGAKAGVPNKDKAAAIAQQAAMASGGLMVPSVTPASFSRMPEVPAGKPLAKVPDPALVEDTPNGPLPKISADGRSPLQAYARPFDRNDRRPRLSVIVAGLGLSPAATEAAITRLPAAVTLAFDPYASGLEGWLAMARERGHEILLSVPLEPDNFPVQDPGPYSLLTSFDPPENLRRLEFLMARMGGYVGVLFRLGSRFTAEEKHIRPVLMAIKGRGVMLVDTIGSKASQTMTVAAELGLARTRLDIVLDRSPSRTRVDAKLAAFEEIGRRKSRAVAIGLAYPSTLERIAVWAATLKAKKMVLAPISALADKSVKAPKTPKTPVQKPEDLAKAAAKTE
jgi:uncharacterized protein